MSLFQFKVSSLSKLKNNNKSESFLPKKTTETDFLNEIKNVTPRKPQCDYNLSQFVLDETDLWDDDSSDIFELPKTGAKKKNDLEVASPIKSEANNKKENEVRPTLIDNVSDDGSINLNDDIINFENDDDNFNVINDDIDPGGDTTEYEPSNSPSPNRESNFDLDFEPYFSPGFANAELIQESKSPVFEVSHKSVSKTPSESTAISTNQLRPDETNSIKSFATDNTQKINFKLPTCGLSDDKLKPLGLGKGTGEWLDKILENDAFHNVSPETPSPKLQDNLMFLNKAYLEILEKVASAFEVLPMIILKEFPDFDPNVFITLRTTKRRIKALTIKTENIMKKKNQMEPSSMCQNLFETPTNSFSKLNGMNAINKNLSGFLNSPASEINNKSTISLNSSCDNSFSHQQSSVPFKPAADDLGGVKQDVKSGLVDYTEVLYKSPKKDGQDCKTPNKNMRNDSLSGEFDGFNFPHSNELLRTFKQKFGLKSFRTNQLQVINAALLGHDCFVLMPTGGGKSLCYQLPAIISRGVTVVISPLRSLILDQVTKLLTLDIAASHLSGEITESEVSAVYRRLNMPEPDIKLLYVTPEKVGASSNLRNCFMGLYKRNMLARFVIDEAHCVSQWGHDFRPDYKRLRELRENYPKVNIMALTATATPRVRIDILHQLLMTNPKWFLSSFNRTNLSYEVREKKGKSSLKDIASLIQNNFSKETGIVYCLSRKECEDVAKDLKNYGIMAIPYHAGLNDTERTRVQNMWMNGKAKVVCATIAFGMGIDKLDVRFVIHYTLPKSIEGYYQESGRAGRDGEKSTCLLYYCYRDKHRILKLINMDQSMATREARKIHVDNLFRVVAFAENKTDCRRALQLEYFGEKFNRKACLENKSTACDNCLQQGMYETLDVTAQSKAIVAAVKQVCGTNSKMYSNYTMLHFVEIFKGTGMKKVESEGHDKLPLCGMGKSWQRLDAERLFRKLIMEEYLTERILVKDDGVTCVYLKMGRRGEDLLRGGITITFEVKKTKKSLAQSNSDKISNEKRMDPAVLEIQEKCYSELTDVIRGIASSLNCNPNAIMNVQALRAMSSSLPRTAEEMLTINHVTTANFEKYGNILLEITKRYAMDKDALSVVLPEVNEEDFFVSDPWLQPTSENSPYFDTDITYCGKEGKSGGKKRRKTNYKKWQTAKKWKGSGGGGASGSRGAPKGKSTGKGTGKMASDGSGVKTISGSTFSTLMELPTNKSRGFPRPKVILKNL